MQRITAVAAVVLAVLALGGFWFAARQNTTTLVPAQLVRYAPLDANQVEFSWRMDPYDDQLNEPGTCVFRAQDKSKIDVGYVYIPLPMERTMAEYRMNTLALASTVELLGCEIGELSEGIAEPVFRPGRIPPAQQAPGYAPDPVD